MFSYEPPSGWAENPHPQGSRILEFSAGGALITLTILPDTAGGLAANVNRWRGQLGLEPLDEAAIRTQVRPVPLLELEGNFVELKGADRAILCTFTIGPPFSIFLKLDGPVETAAAQKASFEAFARTLKANRK